MILISKLKVLFVGIERHSPIRKSREVTVNETKKSTTKTTSIPLKTLGRKRGLESNNSLNLNLAECIWPNITQILPMHLTLGYSLFTYFQRYVTCILAGGHTDPRIH